eukprot:CAMPEP_0202479140 /NCGR_PEP_ID=MMETSP1360-20130828/94822_1 /ASSEMBLY_ACC=CAM_ASM_000848 /TAXON_ID=515479 /ORGANISM="Licmophora paradoxa, Strain CCMP2313" /LENGTH=376 /DNA_ID=CAMNT_0049106453 /DNA_START=135 /DNA_END=1262 /DNA_ORIENTATION=+
MAHPMNNNVNNANNVNDNNAVIDGNTRTASNDLHEAILANSKTVVEFYLEHGADPNLSPQLAPINVVTSANQERARDLHRTLGRVFRSRQNGTIRPLHVAVCNAYHHCELDQRDDSLGIIKALLDHGADANSTCSGIAFCNVGSHPSVTIASAKNAAKLALFLKRFPRTDHEVECSANMDEVASTILEVTAANRLKENKDPGPTEIVRADTKATWKGMFENPKYADIKFVCPDGEVEAHKCVLAAALPYFHTAFQGSWRETNNDGLWSTTNSAAIIRGVLKFIYTGEVENELLEGDMSALFSVASEYQMDSLMKFCEQKMNDRISSYTVKSTMSLAHLHSLSNLKKSCFDFIRENSATLLTDPAIMSISTENKELW